jgi:signal transduction histidine kinase
MSDPASPFKIALVASRREDHDLVAALLSQYSRSRFELDVYPDVASARQALAARRHDAYLIDGGLLQPGTERPSDTRVAAERRDQTDGRYDEDLFGCAVGTGRPVIVLADEDEAVADEGYVAAGAWDCLVKFTLTPPLLARSLRRGIEHRRQRTLEHHRREVQKMEALARLAGGMAHDFNNLLTAMLGYAEMLRESLDPGDARREDVLEIQRAGERASALTRQLLTFGRRATGQSAPIDLNVTLRRMEQPLASLLGEGVSLSIDCGPSVRDVRLESGRFELLLTNLATNARDAMPKGGRVLIETRNVDLDPSHAAAHPGARPGPHVLLLVADEGSGMSTEVRSHLFEPFYTTKGKGKGTGLGLAMVFGIVQQARGHIEVESEIGTGTTIRIYLPAA